MITIPYLNIVIMGIDELNKLNEDYNELQADYEHALEKIPPHREDF